MGLNTIRILLFLSFFSTFEVVSQTGGLRIQIYDSDLWGTPCLQLTVHNQSDTIYAQTLSYEDEILLDSVAIGNYTITYRNCHTDSEHFFQSITKDVEIKTSQLAKVYFTVSQTIRYSDLEPFSGNEIVTERMESQLEFSYFDYRWNPDGNNPKFNFGLGIAGYYWNSFSKHFGVLAGSGIRYMYAPLREDSLANSIYQEDIHSNYYSYLSAQFDGKIRFSSLNQQSATIKAHAFMIDLGVMYNLPLYFKKVTRFNLHDKMVQSFIHQYTDARIYLNAGFTNIQLFVSYRPFDFIRGDLQEMPRLNTGIRFKFNY